MKKETPPMQETLPMTASWDKTFPKSETAAHEKITFHNRYGIPLAADLYRPKGAEHCPPLRYAAPLGL